MAHSASWVVPRVVIDSYKQYPGLITVATTAYYEGFNLATALFNMHDDVGTVTIFRSMAAIFLDSTDTRLPSAVPAICLVTLTPPFV